MADVVDLGLTFRGALSSNIRPEGVTVHYGGPSPWSGGVGRADHGRCSTIVRSWHSYHLSKGWSGLAYSAVVCPHGTIYKGRWRGKRTAANGTNPGNQRSYAVCYLAGDDDPVTEPAKRAFHDAAHALGQPLRWNHSEWKSTSCAGDPIRAWQRAGWPLPGGTTPTPQPTSKDWFKMATKEELRQIVREEVEARSNVDLKILTAFIADNAATGFHKVAEWTKAMSDLTVTQIKGR